MQKFDLVINGGGIVGLTLALSLAKQSTLQVAVIDAQNPMLTWPKTDRDLRVSSINNAQQQCFERLVVWEDMREYATPFTKILAWDSVGKSSINFDSTELGVPCLGVIIENRVVRRALWQALQQCEHVTFFCPNKITSAAVFEDHVNLKLSDQTELETSLLVGADGAQSWVREHFDFKLKTHDYHHHALVAQVACEKVHGKTARQVFLPTGPLAFLPLDGPNLVSIVWSTNLEHAENLLSMTTAEFDQALTQASENVLGQLTTQSKRVTFPLTRRRVTEMVKSRIALIGDAAHTIHPLAGQGLNLGLQDAIALAEVLSNAQQKQRDIGHCVTLRKFERARKADIITMMAAMDGFKTLFSNDKTPWVGLRNLGFQLTDQLPQLKKAFMRHAVG